MRNKLTDKFLENVKAPTEGRLEVFDTLTPGFGVRVGKRGRPVFFVMYRVHGKQIRQKLGTYPTTSLQKARKEAGEALDLASGGADPKLEALRKRKQQFKIVAQEFLERYAKVHQKPTSYKQTQRYVEKTLIPEWGHLPITKITRHHVHTLLDELVDAGKGTTANRTLATMSKLFNWSLERGYLKVAPTQGVKAPAKEVSRDRVLTLDEIRAIWRGAGELAYPFGPWTKMMFATGGQREGDVARMQWAEIRGAWWEIQEPTKSAGVHRVPLSTLALDLLDEAPRLEGPYVFSTRGGEVPISGFSRCKARLDKKSKVSGWRFHDIRRTVATMFGEHLGQHPYVIERIQNRRSGTIKGVTAVYNRATYENEITKAMGEWGKLLKSIVSDKKLVALHG